MVDQRGGETTHERATATIRAEDWVRTVQEAHGGELFAFAARSLGERQAAEEVVQDTLVRAWRKAHTYDPARGSLRTWLFAIARNLVVDRQRAMGSRVAPRAGLDAAAGVHDAVESAALDRAIEGWRVAEALERLTPDHRQVIVDTYFRGWTVAETAARTGLPVGTVKSRLHYALRALRLVLEETGTVG